MILDFKRLPPDEQLARARCFEQAMRTRRSVREFSTDPVPVEILQSAIRTAAAAPSGANKQPWRFVVVGSQNLKQKICEAAEAAERENYERRFPQEWLDDLKQFETSWRKPFLEDAPWLIVVFRVDYEVDAAGAKRKHYYVSESVGIAVGFLLVALHHAGLATLTHTPSPMGFLRDILGRPANERPYLLIPVGYPAEGATVPSLARKPLEDVMVEL